MDYKVVWCVVFLAISSLGHGFPSSEPLGNQKTQLKTNESDLAVVESEQNYEEPLQNQTDPEQDLTEPEQDLKEPDEDLKGPEEESKEPEQDLNEPPQDSNEPEHDIKDTENESSDKVPGHGFESCGGQHIPRPMHPHSVGPFHQGVNVNFRPFGYGENSFRPNGFSPNFADFRPNENFGQHQSNPGFQQTGVWWQTPNFGQYNKGFGPNSNEFESPKPSFGYNNNFGQDNNGFRNTGETQELNFLNSKRGLRSLKINSEQSNYRSKLEGFGSQGKFDFGPADFEPHKPDFGHNNYGFDQGNYIPLINHESSQGGYGSQKPKFEQNKFGSTHEGSGSQRNFAFGNGDLGPQKQSFGNNNYGFGQENNIFQNSHGSSQGGFRSQKPNFKQSNYEGFDSQGDFNFGHGVLGPKEMTFEDGPQNNHGSQKPKLEQRNYGSSLGGFGSQGSFTFEQTGFGAQNPSFGYNNYGFGPGTPNFEQEPFGPQKPSIGPISFGADQIQRPINGQGNILPQRPNLEQGPFGPQKPSIEPIYFGADQIQRPINGQENILPFGFSQGGFGQSWSPNNEFGQGTYGPQVPVKPQKPSIGPIYFGADQTQGPINGQGNILPQRPNLEQEPFGPQKPSIELISFGAGQIQGPINGQGNNWPQRPNLEQGPFGPQKPSIEPISFGADQIQGPINGQGNILPFGFSQGGFGQSWSPNNEFGQATYGPQYLEQGPVKPQRPSIGPIYFGADQIQGPINGQGNILPQRPNLEQGPFAPQKPIIEPIFFVAGQIQRPINGQGNILPFGFSQGGFGPSWSPNNEFGQGTYGPPNPNLEQGPVGPQKPSIGPIYFGADQTQRPINGQGNILPFGYSQGGFGQSLSSNIGFGQGTYRPQKPNFDQDSFEQQKPSIKPIHFGAGQTQRPINGLGNIWPFGYNQDRFGQSWSQNNNEIGGVNGFRPVPYKYERDEFDPVEGSQNYALLDGHFEYDSEGPFVPAEEVGRVGFWPLRPSLL